MCRGLARLLLSLIALWMGAAALAQAQTPADDVWLLHLAKNVDPDGFAAQLCAPSNQLKAQYAYSCIGSYSLLARAVAGRFSRDAVRAVQLKYKGAIEYATRSRGLTVGDELINPEERRLLASARLRLLAEQEQHPHHPPAGFATGSSPNSTTAAKGDGGDGTSVAAAAGAAAGMGDGGGGGRGGGGRGGGGGGGGAAARRWLPEQLDPVTWGLDRIDQAALPLDGVFRYNSTGTGVTVYVLDSGIRSTHSEFRYLQPGEQGTPASGPALSGTRVAAGFSALGNADAEDCYGHGTHVASLVGGVGNGVAKNATLVPVQVLDCYGNTDEPTLLKGLEWVAAHIQLPAVVHMSLEGYYSAPVNGWVEELVHTYGAVVVAAAGNRNRDSCRVSPASASSAITVAAVDRDNTRWAYSNWGACVDVFAPGVSVLAAVPWSDSAAGLKTGTSMAAPMVSGVAAAYLAEHPGASPADVTQRITRSCLTGAVLDDRSGLASLGPLAPGASPWGPIDISSTPNRMLQSALQVLLSPSLVSVGSSGEGAAAGAAPAASELQVALLQRPEDRVTLSTSVPLGWDGLPLAVVFPPSLDFTPDTYGTPQRLLLQPSPGGAQGPYFVTLTLRSSDPNFDFVVHTFRVLDSRLLAGETAANPRLIRSLPFSDAGSTSAFRHDYDTSPGNPEDTSPDVVYALTPAAAASVTASTCGSGFDTVLLLGLSTPTDPPGYLDPSSTLANDDDRTTCDPAASNSRVDADLRAGVTYYIVVSGYNGAAGRYQLNVWCRSGCEAWGASAGGGGAAGGSTSALGARGGGAAAALRTAVAPS